MKLLEPETTLGAYQCFDKLKHQLLATMLSSPPMSDDEAQPWCEAYNWVYIVCDDLLRQEQMRASRGRR